jgi:cell division protein FtsZ
MLEFIDETEFGKTKIKVVGVGGAGNNAIRRMRKDGVQGVELIGINTAIKDLGNPGENMLQIGAKLTKGLGAGARPDVGQRAAEESREAITRKLEGADMVIVTCGMGGGTGTGAAPVVAKISRELGILTVAIVTKPFRFEGSVRAKNAAWGIEKMSEVVDTLVVVPNDKLLIVLDKKATMTEAFEKGDEVLRQCVQGITEIINVKADINVDFADVRTVMTNNGMAHLGIGIGRGEDKAIKAVKLAIESPLLETDISEATSLIVSVTGDISVIEVGDAVRYIEEKTGNNLNVILGLRYDETMRDACSITVIATGIGKRG